MLPQGGAQTVNHLLLDERNKNNNLITVIIEGATCSANDTFKVLLMFETEVFI